MVLSDIKIKEYLKSGKLGIDPLPENGIQPASVDLTLGDHFLVIEANHMDYIDIKSEIKYREIISESVTVPAHSFILATINEYVKIPSDLVAFVEGRSSVGRTGLFIHNAGLIDPGFEGKITLELFNANSLPIKLISGRRICQLVICELDQAAENPYKGKYQGQSNTVGSRIFLDVENKKINSH